MEKKENQRIMLTKRLLKNSLLELLEQKNIKKISVSELCQKAGINRSTFYNHYGSQFDVLKDMELDMINDLDNIWENGIHKDDWTLSKRATAFCRYLSENKRFVKLIFLNCDIDNGNIDSEFSSLLINAAHVHNFYTKNFSNEKEKQKHNLMTTFVAHGTYQMVRKWLIEDMPITPEEMGELISKMAARDWGNSIFQITE